jgi:hypothetical protein
MAKKQWICLSSVAFLSLILSAQAQAITCDGNFQVQKNGRRIATPYCEDTYLAHVARQHGMRVNARAIRNNPSVKEEACQIAGDDNRVRDTCAPYIERSFDSNYDR